MQSTISGKDIKMAKDYIAAINNAFKLNLDLRESEDEEGGFELGEMTRPVASGIEPQWNPYFILLPLNNKEDSTKNNIQLLSLHYYNGGRYEPPGTDDKVEGEFALVLAAVIKAVDLYICDIKNNIAESIYMSAIEEVY